MEWIGTILKSKITKYAFSFIVVLHYKMLCIYVLKWYMHTAKLTIALKQGIIYTAVS